MRLFMSLGFGVSVAILAAPAFAGSAVNYQTENEVKVYRATPSTTLSQSQLAYMAQQKRHAAVIAEKRALAQAQAAQTRKAEQAYERGFEKGFAAAQKQAKRSSRTRYRRNRYNYGRRYVTSYSPFYYGYR